MKEYFTPASFPIDILKHKNLFLLISVLIVSVEVQSMNKIGLLASDTDSKEFRSDEICSTLTECCVPVTSGGHITLVHVTKSQNIEKHITYLDHPSLNNNPDAFLVISQMYGKYNPNEVGVWYNRTKSKWSVFNQNLVPMPVGTSFNIFIVDQSKIKHAFVHKANSSNTTSNGTAIDYIGIYKLRNPVIVVTQKYGVYNTSTVGVRPSKKKWRIFNNDRTMVPNGALFNVIAFEQGDISSDGLSGVAIRTKSMPQNISNHILKLKQGMAKEQKAMVFYTQKLQSIYCADVQGVWWTGNEWTIYNQNLQALPQDLYYHVLMIEPIVPFIWIPPIMLNTPKIESYAEGSSGPYKSNKLLPTFSEQFDFEYVIKDNEAIYQGDIVLGNSNEVVSSRPTPHPRRPNFKKLYNNNKDGIGSSDSYSYSIDLNNDASKWFFGIMPYAFDPAWTSREKEILESHIKELDQLTNLTLVPREAQEYFIFFKKVDGLNGGSSPIGRQIGGNTIKLGGTWKSVVIHEIMHSAGIWHEQSRSDRGAHIEILENNIKEDKKHNFAMLTSDATKIGSYDKKSIMHYGGSAFGITDENGRKLPTIIDKNTGRPFVSSRNISPGDIIGLNTLYKKDYAEYLTPSSKIPRSLKLVIKELKAMKGDDGNGEQEYFAKVTLGNGLWNMNSFNGDYQDFTTDYQEGEHIRPNWTFSYLIPISSRTAKIRINIMEDDGILADDYGDVNPVNGVTWVDLLLYLDTGQIWISETGKNINKHYIGQIGQDIEMEGFDTLDHEGDGAVRTLIKFKVTLQ